MWYVKSSPVAEVILHDVPEQITLASLFNTTFLNKQSSEEGSSDENFRMWITEEGNRESGGKYRWDSAQLALKKVIKKKQTAD